MHQLMAHDEHGLGLHGQDDGEGHVFPDVERIHQQNLPQAEDERRRPQKRPGPDWQVVPEQAAFRGFVRIHVAPVHAQCPVKRPRHAHEEKRRQQPPAAVDQRDDDQRKDGQRQIVGEGVPERRFDARGDVSLIRGLGRPLRLNPAAWLLPYGSS